MQESEWILQLGSSVLNPRLRSNPLYPPSPCCASPCLHTLTEGHLTLFIAFFLLSFLATDCKSFQVNIPSFQRRVIEQRFFANLCQHQASLRAHLCNQTSRDHIENTGSLSERQTNLPTQGNNIFAHTVEK